MANITLKQMRYFEALARHGHFGRAAEASSISQPALSMQIREMEEALGTALFERGARHVRLTGFGEEVAERVADILRAADELGDMARARRDRLAGRLRLGVIPTIAPYLLPAIIGDLSRAYTHLDLHVRETVTPNLLAELDEGRLDAALLALPISEPWLTEAALFAEDFALVRPASAADDPVPEPAHLRDMRLLLLEEGHCFRDQALAFCNLGGGGPRDGLDGSSLSTLVQMVAAGLGVTLIPQMAVTLETRSIDVVVSKFRVGAPERVIGLVWRKTTPLAPQLAQMAEIIRLSAHRELGDHITAI